MDGTSIEKPVIKSSPTPKNLTPPQTSGEPQEEEGEEESITSRYPNSEFCNYHSS